MVEDDELRDSVRRAHQRIDELGDDLIKLMLSTTKSSGGKSSNVPAFPWKLLIGVSAVIITLVLVAAGLINWENIVEAVGWVDVPGGVTPRQ